MLTNKDLEKLKDIERIKKAWGERIDYNAHDMGEMGMFIRTKYVKNYINEILEEMAEASHELLASRRALEAVWGNASRAVLSHGTDKEEATWMISGDTWNTIKDSYDKEIGI
jgi:hypothetical protein